MARLVTLTPESFEIQSEEPIHELYTYFHDRKMEYGELDISEGGATNHGLLLSGISIEQIREMIKNHPLPEGIEIEGLD